MYKFNRELAFELNRVCDSHYYICDAKGKTLKTMSVSNAGEIVGVSNSIVRPVPKFNSVEVKVEHHDIDVLIITDNKLITMNELIYE